MDKESHFDTVIFFLGCTLICRTVVRWNLTKWNVSAL